MNCVNRIEKMAEEALTLAVEFVTELAAGETLSAAGSITSTPTGPTLGAPAISGSQVKFSVTGGTDGQSYSLKLTGVTTSGGNTLGATCDLDVKG